MPASTILLRADEINKRIQELAREIDADYRGADGIYLICVLNGAFMFLADLIRHMKTRVTLDFIALSSYAKNTRTSGEVRLLKDLNCSIEGRDVLVVEDIVDTGMTLSYLQDILRARSPKSLRTACLLSRMSRRVLDVKVDYVGFNIGDRFVVGYGLDHAEQYRSLPYVAILDENERPD